MKRSTQFCMHGSSLLSSLPEEILPVMHLRKHVSVSEWMAVFLGGGSSLAKKIRISFGQKHVRRGKVFVVKLCSGKRTCRELEGICTLLDARLLRLVDDELLQVLLFGVGHLGQVDVGGTERVHCDCAFRLSFEV